MQFFKTGLTRVCQPVKVVSRTLILPGAMDKKGLIYDRKKLAQPHSFSCTCGFCTSRNLESKSNDVGGFTSDDENVELLKNKELLQKALDKNIELEREIKQLKLQAMHSHHHHVKNTVEEDPDIAQLLENNRQWVKERAQNDPHFFDRIGKKQTPKYLYIGCSDSRVPANEILGLGPGEVFVHRNVGNQVIGNDLNVLSVVEFAVQFLNVQHIIVTGHYDCGAVRAATETKDLGLLENWLRSIRDVYRIHHAQLSLIDDNELKHRRLVELNVMEQCLNLYKTGVVQRKRKECATNGQVAYPRIHAMVFDPKIGLLHKLPINFKKTIAQYKEVYNLY